MTFYLSFGIFQRIVNYWPRRSLICVASVSVAECSSSVAHPVVVYCDWLFLLLVADLLDSRKMSLIRRLLIGVVFYWVICSDPESTPIILCAIPGHWLLTLNDDEWDWEWLSKRRTIWDRIDIKHLIGGETKNVQWRLRVVNCYQKSRVVGNHYLNHDDKRTAAIKPVWGLWVIRWTRSYYVAFDWFTVIP